MRAIITGASAGIGRDMARLLAARGYDLTLIARREDGLRALAAELPVSCQILTADLSSVRECRLVYEAARGDGVQILINNAGFGLFGPFAETDLDTELRMIQTNVVAVHVLTKLFLQDFRKRGSGYILNVASSAGFMAGPLMATYYATKNYVLRLTQAIREELRQEGCGVQVAALCPGPVDTEFNRVADVRFSIGGLSSETVARCAINGMFRGKGVIVPGLSIKLGLAVRRLAPEALVTRVAYHIQHRKG